jgi:hypothetical protein
LIKNKLVLGAKGWGTEGTGEAIAEKDEVLALDALRRILGHSEWRKMV